MKFSIIVPCYNSAAFLENNLISLENQIYQNFEVLFIDDGSTDNTKEVIEKFIQRNKNWKYFYKENNNWGSVINYVHDQKLINGDYVTILDSDDWFVNNCLLRVNQVLEDKKNIDVLITSLYFLYKNNFQIKKVNTYFAPKSKYIKKQHSFTPISMPHGKFYCKEIFYQKIQLKEKISYQDMVLFNDLLSKSNKVYFLKEPLVVWWKDRIDNSTNVKWDNKKIDLFLNVIEDLETMSEIHSKEITSYSLFYLLFMKRELNKNQINCDRKVVLNTKKIKFKWLPISTRTIFKIITLWWLKDFYFKKSKSQ